MFCSKCGTENTDTSKFCRKCGMPLRQPKEANKPAAAPQPAPKTTLIPPAKPPPEATISLLSRVAGLFCYMFWFVSGIIFLLANRKNDFVRFHAWQSTMAFIIMVIIFALFRHIIIWLLIVLLWLFLMVKAFQGKTPKLPGIGNLAWRLSRR